MADVTGHEVSVWDLATHARKTLPWPGHQNDYLTKVAWIDNHRLAVTSPAGLLVWDTSAGTVTPRHDLRASLVAPSPDGSLIAAHDAFVEIASTRDGRAVDWLMDIDGAVRDLSWSPDGHFLAIRTDNGLHFWEPPSRPR